MSNPTNPSFFTTSNRQGQKLQELIDTLDDASRSKNEGPSFIPGRSTTPVPDFLSKLPNHPQLSAQIRKILQNEAKLISALEIDKSLKKAVKDKFLNSFQIVFKPAEVRLKNASFHFVKRVLAHFSQKGASTDILGRINETWAQSLLSRACLPA